MSLRLDSVVRAELQQPMADSPEEEEEEEEDEEEEEEAMEMESDEAEGGNSVLTICEDQAQIGKDGGTGTNMQQSRFGSCSNPLNLRLGGRGNKIEFRKSSSLSMEISAPRRDQRTSSHGFRDSSSVDTEAIESLLLLGREPILSPQTIKDRSSSLSMSPCSQRRYSSGSGGEMAFDHVQMQPQQQQQLTHPVQIQSQSQISLHQQQQEQQELMEKQPGTYYQKMRERNNEASKRCRLKRRLKAESLESQAQMLNFSNKILRQRIVRLEQIGKVLKDGVKGINANPVSGEPSCKCVETVALVKKTNLECQDVSKLSNRALIDSSRICRTNGTLTSSLSSEDESIPTTSNDDNSYSPPVLISEMLPSSPKAAAAAATVAPNPSPLLLSAVMNSKPAGSNNNSNNSLPPLTIPQISLAKSSSGTSLTPLTLPTAAQTFLGQYSKAVATENRPTPVIKMLTFPGRSELSVTPIMASPTKPPSSDTPPIFVPTRSLLSSQAPSSSSSSSPSSSISNASTPKTALDVLNETIIKSLSSNGVGSRPPPSVPDPPSPITHSSAAISAMRQLQQQQKDKKKPGVSLVPLPQMPLNLAKLIPPPSSPSFPTSNSATSSSPLPPKQIFLLNSPHSHRQRASVSISSSSPNHNASHIKMEQPDASSDMVTIKCEPEIQIVNFNNETDRVQEVEMTDQTIKTDSKDELEDGGGVDPTLTCTAAAHGSAGCSGPLTDLRKLTSYLDLISKTVTRDSGTAAMERAIIKSRMRIPFWKADEVETFICSQHRRELVHSSPLNNCAMCNKKRAKKATSPQAVMMTITYRMSLENYTTSGNILPIGMLVCGHCKDKCLKGVDFTNSQVVSSEMVSSMEKKSSGSSSVVIAATSSTNETKKTKAAGKIGTNPPSLDAVKDESRAASAAAQGRCNRGSSLPPSPSSPAAVTSTRTTPPASATPTPQPQATEDNIFTKITRLNDALSAINPSYKPVGFSITSIESCSESVLADAVSATETAVTTLMSVIAPGQESFLWKAIEPKLEDKFNPKQKHD